MIGYMQGVRDTLTRTGLMRRSRPSLLAVFAFGAGIGLIAGAAVACAHHALDRARHAA